MLHLSVSSLEDWLTCKRLYFWKRIKKYDRIEFNIPYLVGRVIHVGISYVFNKRKDAVEAMRDYFRKEKLQIKENLPLTPEQEEDLNEQEFITQGMLKAYCKRYEKMLRNIKLIQNEVEGCIDINDNTKFVFKLDNLLMIGKNKVLHELKTTKYITPEYVRRIQTDFQPTLYYYAYNLVFEDSPISEIMYDVIKKPSIRQKKNEQYKAFLKRLEDWYETPDDMGVFHIERFEKPKMSEDEAWNTISNISKEILSCKHKEDYYMNTKQCYDYYGKVCPYVELCFNGGETKENLVLYQIRKSHHISK